MHVEMLLILWFELLVVVFQPGHSHFVWYFNDGRPFKSTEDPVPNCGSHSVIYIWIAKVMIKMMFAHS